MVPYGTQKESFTAFSIVSGNRPPRPSTITANRWVSDPIWKIIRWCWNQTPQSRLSAEVLHRGFAGLDVELEGTPVTMDGEGEHNMAWFNGELVLQPTSRYNGRLASLDARQRGSNAD